MNVTNATDPAATPHLPTRKIRPSSANTTNSPAAMADVGDRNVGPDEQDQRLYARAESAGRPALGVAPLHLPPRVPDREKHQRRRDQHEHHVLGGGDVEPEQLPAGG